MGPTLVFFLFVTFVFISIEGRFDRDCSQGTHCVFQPSGSDAKAYLACTHDGKKCACESYRDIADVAAWYMEMEDGKCTIALTGPCGEANGLQVGCRDEHVCIQGRCRDNQQLGKGDLFTSCNGDIDCLPTLRCKVVGFYYRKMYGCIKPETPPYNPAVLGLGHMRNNKAPSPTRP